MDHCITQNNVDSSLTLGNLFKEDLPEGYILPVYPCSINNQFRCYNEAKYRLFAIDEIAAEDWFVFLQSLRICCVAGNDLPIVLPRLPSEFALAHWKKWCPHFIDPVIKTVDVGLADSNTLVTYFPFDAIPRERHAVDPEMHYHILKKSAIAETGAPHPKYYKKNDIKFPCMIKLDQSLGGFGNYVVENREKFEEVSNMINTRFGSDSSYVISEYIQDVQCILACGFYVGKSGRIRLFGIQECTMEIFAHIGGYIDWNKHEQYKQQLYRKFVVPVSNYLHKKGYFGIVGLDIIRSPSGDYLVDMNSRVNGSTPVLILSHHMMELGFSHSRYDKCNIYNMTSKQLVEKANSINEKTSNARIVILATADEGKKCRASVAAFSDSKEMVDSLQDQLCYNE